MRSPLGCLSLRNSATEIAAPFLTGVRFTTDCFCEPAFVFAMLESISGGASMCYSTGGTFAKLSKKYLICKTCALGWAHKPFEIWRIEGQWKTRCLSDYANKDLTGDSMWRVRSGTPDTATL